MVSNRKMSHQRKKTARVLPFLILIAGVTLHCFNSEKSLPGVTGSGQITGKVVGSDGTAIVGVQVTTTYKGQTMTTVSDQSGKFSFNVKEVERGQGFNLAFAKTSFDNANQAAVITLPNLKVDLGNVLMFISGGTEVLTRRITGQIYDNFSYKPLVGANVTTTDSAGQVLVVTTDEVGKFTITSNYFALESSFAVSVFKSNYITRTDLVSKITAEESPIRNNPVRLYHKFGSVYAYVADDSQFDGLGKPLSLDGVSVSLTNSNNQVLTCVSGTGANPAGPYDTVPLIVGAYCPDLTGITSPMSLTLPAAPPRTNNSGGVKLQNDFLFTGSRYIVNLSKTSAACTSRTAGTANCYRSKQTYVDIQLVGDNPISGGSTSLFWDAWIHGTTTGGQDVTVKLYNSSNTYIAETITNASGEFLFDSTAIVRNQQYKLTFEKAGYYSRPLGFSDSGYQTRAGDRVSGSSTITGINSTADLVTGLVVAGLGIPGGATISSILGPNSIQISAAASSTGTATMTFTPTARTGTKTAGNPVITGISTTGLVVGLAVSGTGIASDARITNILSATSIQLNGNALTGGATTLTFSNVYQSPIPVTVLISGANNTGSIPMTALPPPTHCVRGTVKDYWSTLPIPNATVAVFDGGWRTATTDTLGQFYITGNFGNTAVNAFDVEISKPGYTGSTLVNKQTFKFTHDGNATCLLTPYDLDTVGACNATGVGPTGGANCVNNLVLYQVGVFAVINGGTRFFTSQVKQTYEKFLTEKTGLTISGRTGDLKLTSGPQKTEDYHGIYLHFDDTPRVLSNVPEGKWSNNVPVNPLSTKCTSTVTTNCSPRTNGVITESIGTDTRIIPWDIKTYVFYHFYAAAPGAYTIETTGSTDTKITLIAQTGANMGSDDDSGSGSNARIGPINLLRGWYYIKVMGKDDNVFGFFDVSVTGPTQAETNYSTMFSPPVEPYQTVAGTATYSTNCAPNNGNLVVSWYDAVGHLLYIAAPGENGGCSASATMEKHGPIGDIVRGRFDGNLRPIAPGGANATITSTLPFRGFYNIIRQE